jgi:tRNA(fMet)-specific endonuclease VapC
MAAQRLVRQIVDAFPGKMILHIEKGDARFHYAKLRARLFELFAPRDAKGRATTNYVSEWVDPTSDLKLGVNENDIWIASLALAHNLTLVTADKMVHIRKAAGTALNYENWEE